MSHDHHHELPRTPVEERVDALEALLIEKGLLDTETIDAVVEYHEHAVGPMNGSRVVARAWMDPAYRARLLEDGTAAIGELAFGGPEGEHMVVVENTALVHNAVVCTLCSCYPWPVLGLPPNWYKSPPYPCPLCRIPGAVVHYAMRPDGTGGRKPVAIGIDCPNARCANFSPDAARYLRTGKA